MDPRSALIATSVAAGLSAVATIAVRYQLASHPWAFYIFKPLTSCLILSAALMPATRGPSMYGAAIVAGLIFSLAGDIWLMLPRDRFVPGLISFLFAHLSYSFAFATAGRFGGFPWPAVPLALMGALMLWYLWPALPSKLTAPVSVYLLAIVVMVSLAGYRASVNPSAGALAAAVGAALFYVSDALLAVDRFRRKFRLAEALVLGTYFAGQLLIALSVAIPVVLPT